jgi:hypothetical protein
VVAAMSAFNQWQICPQRPRWGALPPGSMGNRSVVFLIAFLLKLGSKSPAMSPTAESVRAQWLMGISLIWPLVLKEER